MYLLIYFEKRYEYSNNASVAKFSMLFLLNLLKLFLVFMIY